MPANKIACAGDFNVGGYPGKDEIILTVMTK